MNSLYGAMANAYFIYYTPAMAESITTSGQLSVKTSEKFVNTYLNKILGSGDKDYCIAIDTDSVIGGTEIVVNNKKMPIDEFYEKSSGVNIKNDEFNENFIKQVLPTYYTNSVNKKGEVESKKVVYVMKHKVSKEMYNISLPNGDNVTVTGDHSIIVRHKKTGEISSIKSKKLSPKYHYIINIDTDSGM